MREFYNGCIKQIQYIKRVIMPDNWTSDEISVNKYIEIKPGYTDETILEFQDEGHESIG